MLSAHWGLCRLATSRIVYQHAPFFGCPVAACMFWPDPFPTFPACVMRALCVWACGSDAVKKGV